MERFILKKLLDWKNSPYRKPLILKGVRQVGKTWILKEFGRRCYENTAYFNFDENEEYKQFFETTKDVDRILQNLMLASGQKIVPEKTLIIFDEVQDCPKQPVVQVSDFVGSTAALLKHTVKSDKKQFIVATESGVIHEMRKQSPDKEFIPAPPNDSTCACNECNFMRLNTMEKLYNCLKYELPEIFVDEQVQEKAIRPIKKMLEISERLGL